MSKTFAKKSSYPLEWPGHIPRTSRPQDSRFNTTLYQALLNVEKSLELLAKDSGKKVSHVKLTSNVTLDDKPDDGGVAVYFKWNEADFCIPVDRYNKPADNLQAIHHIVEADRTKLRHGGVAFVMAEKRGQTLMLESPDNIDWRRILGAPEPTQEGIKKAYRKLAKQWHPDNNVGDADMFNRVQKAYEQAKKELGSSNETKGEYHE